MFNNNRDSFHFTQNKISSGSLELKADKNNALIGFIYRDCIAIVKRTKLHCTVIDNIGINPLNKHTLQPLYFVKPVIKIVDLHL